jgi:hypothetical protein
MVAAVPPQVLRNAAGFRVAAALFTLAAAAWIGGACTNDARDSHCAAEEPDEEDCVSNPEGLGPKVSEPLCALPAAGETLAEGESCPSFDEILGFMQDERRGNCIATGCHGFEATASVAIFFPQQALGRLDRCGTYTKLTTTSGSIGRPYVVEDKLGPDGQPDATNEALASWMYCNVAGLVGGGFPMPKPGGVPVKSDAELIRRWIICGAHAEGCETTTGTTGVGTGGGT